MVPAKTVGSGFVFRAVLVAMMVANVGGKENGGRGYLDDAQPEVSRFIEPRGGPHPKMGVIVLDDG